MEKGKRVETVNGEIPLPEAIIQHIQSFLSGKEAARTTILSKSWYNAWLTRPAIYLDEVAFHKLGREPWHAFEELVKKTMKRYRDLNLNIESFRLRSISYLKIDTTLKSAIVSAMTMGASNVELDLPLSLTLPQEVLGSETLLRLSLNGGTAYGKYYVSCSRLKSLSLQSVDNGFNDVFEDIISLCTEMEELSLSNTHGLRPLHLIELHKLRRLSLYDMDIDSKIFSDIATRFPCLKDLTIVRCERCARIQVASSSLETITLEPYTSTQKAKFDIPNIQKFSCAGSGLPHLSIKTSSKEWEFNITIACTSFHKTSWFRNLKKTLAKFRQSRISLSMSVGGGRSEHAVNIGAVPNPLMLENLMIDAPSSSFCALLLRLFGFFRPRFVTAKFCPRRNSNGCLDILCKILMQQVITPNCGIPDQDMFGQFGLKKVNMEVYEMFGKEWQPLALEKPLDPSVALPLEQKVRFELVWD